MRALGLRELIDESARPSALPTSARRSLVSPQFADIDCALRAVGRCEHSFCVTATTKGAARF
jgi:hypothetical protein